MSNIHFKINCKNSLYKVNILLTPIRPFRVSNFFASGQKLNSHNILNNPWKFHSVQEICRIVTIFSGYEPHCQDLNICWKSPEWIPWYLAKIFRVSALCRGRMYIFWFVHRNASRRPFLVGSVLSIHTQINHLCWL